jgi:hypothetical protein
MLKRLTLFLALCLVAGALAPPSHRSAGDRQYGRHIASLARQAGALEVRWNRRDRDAGSERVEAAVWLNGGDDRPVFDPDGEPRAHGTRAAATFPSYHLATHLSL